MHGDIELLLALTQCRNDRMAVLYYTSSSASCNSNTPAVDAAMMAPYR